MRGLKFLSEAIGPVLIRRTPHGVRGLKFERLDGIIGVAGRTPHGVRGLKFETANTPRDPGQSHPSRGAWIEIDITRLLVDKRKGRTPHGVRGLKCQQHGIRRASRGRRTPHGVRGLKFLSEAIGPVLIRRTPHGVRGLKYRPRSCVRGCCPVAPLTGCVD